jgi:thymidylate kinase
MGIKNYLIEGLSGSGKTTVCDELLRRGYQAIQCDDELAYQGDPETGEPTPGMRENHIWHVDNVRALAANKEAVTFFCGGARNLAKFIDLFDGVFVLEVDLDTLNRRLDERPDSDWGDGAWSRADIIEERARIARLHQTKEGVPNGVVIDSTAPVAHVVDEILREIGAGRPVD